MYFYGVLSLYWGEGVGVRKVIQVLSSLWFASLWLPVQW